MADITWNDEQTRIAENDPLDMLQLAERADWALLRMVACVAFATLLLGAAGRLMAV